MNWKIVLASIVAMTACSKERPASASESDTAMVMSQAGYGPVRVGASVAELSAAVGTKVPAATAADDMNCRYVVLNSLPKGMRVMLVHDTVARIDVDAPGVSTVEGIAVGDSESTVLARYDGRAKVMPHKYTGPVGHYVVITPSDTTLRTIFETDGKTVLRYHAGRRPAVEFVEGCA